MEVEHGTLLGLLTILFLGLIVPELFKKVMHLPFVTSIILIGSLLGPHGFQLVQSTEVIDFFGFLGFTFLMLLAGLETHVSDIKKDAKSICILAIINASIPFIAGMTIARYFGYSWMAAILLGTIFVSSSVAIIVPYMDNKNIGGSIKKRMLPAFVVQDLLSMMLLASVFQVISPVTRFPLPAYFLVLAVSVVGMYVLLPKLAKQFIQKRIINKKEQHEDELRFVIVLLIAVLLYFSALGVHPILAAFLVGMLLADLAISKKIATKIHTLGYGLFVPVFFFIVGMEMDVRILLSFDLRNALVLAVVFGLISTKFISGYLAGKIVDFDHKNAAIFGTVSTAQLTTTLAAAYAAATIGVFDEALITAIITLSIVSNILVPIVLSLLINHPVKKRTGFTPTIIQEVLTK